MKLNKLNKKHVFFLTIVLLLFFYWQNNHITVSKYSYRNIKIPIEFNRFKIVHVSDLHNKSFGKNQEYILKKISQSSPDIIVVTGDLIDRRKYDLDTALTFIEGAMDIAPVYYASGNHEAWSGKYENIRKELTRYGVEVLDDTKVEITRHNSKIEILGVTDPAFLTSGYLDGLDTSNISKKLNEMKQDNVFQILLSHRPNLIDIYSKENIDIIFSGHAHGGQFRIPGLGGLISPDQGLIPKYTSGSHSMDNSTIYISRGLGNSIIPIRIFNRPELIVVTLQNP
ncbi:MAG: metallophosphoesterase [Tissierellaceae bacterium]|nr:metallophosphoesterase [Tissierellaceae bacterium]